MGLASSLNKFIAKYRGWEYWDTYWFEWPLYIIGVSKLLLRGLGIKDLCRANWSLDHGGFTFASKYEIQCSFNQEYFPKTVLVDSLNGLNANLAKIQELQNSTLAPFPLILKPDNGRVGKGVVRAQNQEQLNSVLASIEGRYLVQEYCTKPFEAGVFFYRSEGKTGIFSINTKEFPYVTGDGSSSVAELVARDPRLIRFKKALSNQIDPTYVPKVNEHYLLSYVGNHAQGTVFYSLMPEDTSKIIAQLLKVIATLPGFNYGRFDVRADSQAELINGNFIVLEVNGIDSLSTNIFDPSWSVIDAYKKLYEQYSLLISIADQNHKQDMKLCSWPEVFRRTKAAEALLARNHARVMELRLR